MHHFTSSLCYFFHGYLDEGIKGSYSQSSSQSFGPKWPHTVVVQVETGFIQVAEEGRNRMDPDLLTSLQVQLCTGQTLSPTGGIWKEEEVRGTKTMHSLFFIKLLVTVTYRLFPDLCPTRHQGRRLGLEVAAPRPPSDPELHRPPSHHKILNLHLYLPYTWTNQEEEPGEVNRWVLESIFMYI